ncbi:hypothetical protein Q3G72_000382 [Acer saccharum]|nr:hypothetical protein Q3G72_000382 [Acer saccharum]
MVTSYTRWTSHGEELIDHDYNGDYQDLTSSTNEVDKVNEILNDLRGPTPLHDLQDEDPNYDHVDRNWNPMLEPDTFTRLMRDAKQELDHKAELESDCVRNIEKKQEAEFHKWFTKRQEQSEDIINIIEDDNDDILFSRNDIHMIGVDMNVEDQNEFIDNFVDDDNDADDTPFNNDKNEEDYILSNYENDTEEDYISSN